MGQENSVDHVLKRSICHIYFIGKRQQTNVAHFYNGDRLYERTKNPLKSKNQIQLDLERILKWKAEHLSFIYHDNFLNIYCEKSSDMLECPRRAAQHTLWSGWLCSVKIHAISWDSLMSHSEKPGWVTSHALVISWISVRTIGDVMFFPLNHHADFTYLCKLERKFGDCRLRTLVGSP